MDKATATKSASFWVLAAALLCVCMAGSAFMAYCPAWWQMNGFSATAASNWDALYLLLSGLAPLWAQNIIRDAVVPMISHITGM